MSSNILFIEICNFIDYPTGGHLSFAKNTLSAFGNDLYLVGSTTDESDPVGAWFQKEIDGVLYNYFAVKKVKKESKKPFIPARLSSFFWVKRKCKKIFSRTDFDIVLVQTPEVLFAVRKFVSKPLIIEMPGIENPLSISRYKVGKLFSGLYDKVFFRYIKKDDLLLAAADSKAIKSFIERSRGKVTDERVRQFPNSFNEKYFKIRDKYNSRSELNIEPGLNVLITVGRLNWFKGWKFMIDSFEKFLIHKPNSIFVFIGDGEDEAGIRAYICERNLEQKIDLVGRKEFYELGMYLSAADLFIMGSYKEGWSTSLVEAVACGVPCVVTDFSSANDLVENSINGFVVVERNDELFANKMLEAMNLPQSGVEQKAQEIKKFSISNLKNLFYKTIYNCDENNCQ